MNEPEQPNYEAAANDALVGMLQAVKALNVIGAEISKHQRLTSEAVGCGDYAAGLALVMDAHGLVATIDNLLSDIQPRLLDLITRDALRDRERTGALIN